MTTLNTIIEEEKKVFDAKFREKIDFVNYCLSEGDTMFDSTDVKNFLTTAMQRAYEAGIKESEEDIALLTQEIENLRKNITDKKV